MTSWERRQQARLWRTIAVASIVVASVLSIMLVRESSYNEGYNDAYNTGQADGWQGCIEENNLNERYENAGFEY